MCELELAGIIFWGLPGVYHRFADLQITGDLGILAAAVFAAGVLLLVAFARNRDVGVLCIALVAFLWMISILAETSF